MAESRGDFFQGSGDRVEASGQTNTFTTLYPMGHAYWGQIDNASGLNPVDYGLPFSVKPACRLSIVRQGPLARADAEQWYLQATYSF